MRSRVEFIFSNTNEGELTAFRNIDFVDEDGETVEKRSILVHKVGDTVYTVDHPYLQETLDSFQPPKLQYGSIVSFDDPLHDPINGPAAKIVFYGLYGDNDYNEYVTVDMSDQLELLKNRFLQTVDKAKVLLEHEGEKLIFGYDDGYGGYVEGVYQKFKRDLIDPLKEAFKESENKDQNTEIPDEDILGEQIENSLPDSSSNFINFDKGFILRDESLAEQQTYFIDTTATLEINGQEQNLVAILDYIEHRGEEVPVVAQTGDYDGVNLSLSSQEYSLTGELDYSFKLAFNDEYVAPPVTMPNLGTGNVNHMIVIDVKGNVQMFEEVKLAVAEFIEAYAGDGFWIKVNDRGVFRDVYSGSDVTQALSSVEALNGNYEVQTPYTNLAGNIAYDWEWSKPANLGEGLNNTVIISDGKGHDDEHAGANFADEVAEMQAITNVRVIGLQNSFEGLGSLDSSVISRMGDYTESVDHNGDGEFTATDYAHALGLNFSDYHAIAKVQILLNDEVVDTISGADIPEQGLNYDGKINVTPFTGQHELSTQIVYQDSKTQSVALSLDSDFIDFAQLTGNAGSTNFVSGPDSELLIGSNNDDVFSLVQGGDTIYSGAGDDTVRVKAGDNLIETSSGDDYISLSGASSAGQSSGQNTIKSGAGNDVIEISLHTNNIIYLGDGDDKADIKGEAGLGSHTVYGQAGNDTIETKDGLGNAGNDYFDGGLGDDLLRLGGGEDFAAGGEGDDFIDAGDDNDTIYGNGGNDTLWAQAGDDLAYGGVGNDSLVGFDRT